MDANFFATTVLSCIDGFFDWNLVSGKLVLSTSFKTLLGYTKEELNGDNKHFFHENIHSLERDKILNSFSAIFASHRERFSKEFRIKTKRGDFLWIRLQGKIFRDPQSKAVRLSGIMVDVNESRHSTIETAENSENKTRFVAMLNHDMRSPLSAIISTADMVTSEPLTPKQMKYLLNIKQSADLLLKLVSDILDVSKLDAGKLSLEYQPFSFPQAISTTISMMEPGCKQKNLYIEAVLDPNIPSLVVGDITRIQQIIVNFISNAIKFTHKGGISLTTRYTPINPYKGKIYIEIVDTGIGIAADKINMLFKEFSQADASTTRLYGGTGLGLSICKRLVGLMGGEIGVRSKEEAGSTFWFEITVDLPQTKAKPSESDSSLYIIGHLKPLNILVAEDNSVNQEVMMGLLERQNHQVVIAENGQIAVDLFKKGNFDVILMDVNMPVKDGVEACREIRSFNKTIPIIAITANGMESEKQRCLDAGMNDFTTKPVDKVKLAHLLKPYQEKDKILLSENKIENGNTKMNSEIFINNSSMRQLLSDLGEAKIKKLVMLYKQDAPGLIQNLQKNIDMERSAHTLAGMSENLNFPALSKQSRIILQIVREKGADAQINDIINSLPSLYEKTMFEVEKIFS